VRVTQLATKYQETEKKYYYVTPTSYLVLIQSFKELLDKKRNQIDSVIMKYDRGISQLANAKTEVGIL
jgi:dynein heavy chain